MASDTRQYVRLGAAAGSPRASCLARRVRLLPAELADLIPAELSAEKVRELEDLKAEIWKRGQGGGDLRGSSPQTRTNPARPDQRKRSPDDG